ncbi:MAG: hypothetical protein K2N26_08585, partial [Oscillospiraceae bacterium]|nr:hypothetical protein [Oscillospiraceae bacterium]
MKSGKILLGAVAFTCAFFVCTTGCPDNFIPVLNASSAPKTGVAVNETNFPDPAFRKYVSENIDSDGNSLLSADEIRAVKSVSVSGMEIESLAGIEYFTELTSLICQNNSLTELDISSNKALTALSVSGNMLSEINLSRNTELENLDLGMTSKDGATYGNNLTELDLSKNRNLKNLSCVSNSLKTLDLSGCPKMEIVKCSNNRLTELNVAGCGSLRQLECFSNNLKQLDLSGNPDLVRLYCSDNKLTSLDLSSNTSLKTLFCRYNYITRESRLKLYDKSAMSTCDYSLQYYSGYKSYVTDVNMQYAKIITGTPTDIFTVGTGITGIPSADTVSKAGNIEFVCKYADSFNFSVSDSPDLTIDKNNRLTAQKAGEYEFTLTVKKGNADGTDFVKKFTVSVVDPADHTKHEYEWKCDRSAESVHYRQCYCGERTDSEQHKYGNRIYQINDRNGKLYNYLACKICRYAYRIGESSVLKNAASGITVASLDGTIDTGLRLTADNIVLSEIKAAGAVCAYDIYFTDGSSRVKPNCQFKVTIPLPKGADGTKAAVLRRKSDGSFRDMNAEYSSEDGSVSFTAGVSGVYIIAFDTSTDNKTADDNS